MSNLEIGIASFPALMILIIMFLFVVVYLPWLLVPKRVEELGAEEPSASA